MQVEHVYFVSFLAQDIARAKRFYAETLGLELETEGESHPHGNALMLHRRYAPRG